MTLQEGAEKYLSPINDDKKYAEQKRRLLSFGKRKAKSSESMRSSRLKT